MFLNDSHFVFVSIGPRPKLAPRVSNGLLPLMGVDLCRYWTRVTAEDWTEAGRVEVFAKVER